MDITKRILEEKMQMLLAEAGTTSVESRRLILDRINALNEIQNQYLDLCRRYVERFETESNSAIITITQGAVDQNYLNLRAAVSSHLIDKGHDITIRFPGTDLPEIVSGINERSCYLKSRTAARAFYSKAFNNPVGKQYKITRISNDVFDIEAIDP